MIRIEKIAQTDNRVNACFVLIDLKPGSLWHVLGHEIQLLDRRKGYSKTGPRQDLKT